MEWTGQCGLASPQLPTSIRVLKIIDTHEISLEKKFRTMKELQCMSDKNKRVKIQKRSNVYLGYSNIK